MGNATSDLAPDLPIGVPSKALFSFLKTKVWVVPSPDSKGPVWSPADPDWAGCGVVLFRHSGGSGEKKLIVNGHVVSKTTDLLDGGDTIPFTLHGKACRLEVLSFPGLTDYVLYVQDVRVLSIMEEQEPHNINRPSVSVRQAVLEQAGPSVPLYGASRKGAAAAGERTVLFEVLSHLSGRDYLVKKRFKDFDELDCLVRSAFKGHHLYANIPPLPRKRNKMLTDHYTMDFIESRRAELDAYLRCLVSLPHAAKNPDILDFLGIESVPHPSASF